MAFNPLKERGMNLDDQLRNWNDLLLDPYDNMDADPYTKCRVIVMNGIEVEAQFFSHQFARHTNIFELKQALAMSRRVEQQQQKAINWLTPGDETTLELTIAYEQVAVDLTAWVARNEPDPYLKQVYEIGLLEDFDHLYRYSNLYEMLEGKKAEDIVKNLTEVMPGRPTVQEHRHPYDSVRRHFNNHTVDPFSRFHALTVMSAEQQTANFYMTIGNRYMEPIARSLYAEIGMIEEQHVTQYESLIDPQKSWFEDLVTHEYNECYLYYSFANEETDPRIRNLWELHLEMEIGQLQEACKLMRHYEGKDPELVLPSALPDPITFQPNKDYIRNVLAEQCDWTMLGTEPVTEAHERFESYQNAVHGKDAPPSEQVIDLNSKERGRDYRIETEGPHPVERLRQPVTES
jgi:hypothetical protein